MKFPYDSFVPSADPDEVLGRIRRRARRRRITRRSALLPLLFLGLLLVLHPRTPEEPPAVLAIHEVWTGGESARYTLVQSPSGHNIIIFHKEDTL